MSVETTKVIHLFSLDFDGCILPKEKNLTLEKIKKRNQNLLMALREQNKHYSVNIGLVGSNRQDSNTDDLNRGYHVDHHSGRWSCPYSAFSTLKSITEDSDAEFDPFLLADVYAEQAEGRAFNLAVDQSATDKSFNPRYIFDENKLSLLYLYQINFNSLN